MSLNRQAAKTFLKSLDTYDSIKEMVLRAVDPENPSLIKGHVKNRDKLDEAYLDLVHSWKDFKRDLDGTEKDLINKLEDDGSPKYEHNETWLKVFKQSHFELLEKSDALLESSANASSGIVNSDKESKYQLEIEEKSKQQTKTMVNSISNQIRVFTEGVQESVLKISTEIGKMTDEGESPPRVQLIRLDLQVLRDKIDEKLNAMSFQLYSYLEGAELLEKQQEHTKFVKTEIAKIDNLLVILSKKVKDINPITSSLSDDPTTKSSASKQTYLKKTDPPRWDGDPITYAEFVRKWKSQVSSANLLAEQELDRLRDCVPSQASKALFGCNTMRKAWDILEKLYGDKDLIASLLKTQLKSIKAKSKIPHDIVIELATEVNNIVLRLKALDMENMLHVDNEFLSAVYRALPDTSQVRWLEYDKGGHSSKWSAFMAFLEAARDQALQNKVLMSYCQSTPSSEGDNTCSRCGTSHSANKKCPMAKAHLGKVTGGADDDAGRKEREKKARIECGKCPLCKKFHSFSSKKEKCNWPSDRFFRCDEFKSKSVQDRAQVLEDNNACSKCTSWNHQKDKCSLTTKCSETVNGKKCGESHSSMVCGSGNAYCGSLKSHAFSSKNSVIKSNKGLPSDINAETLLFFQDVPISGCKNKSFLCFDSGSTRVLITHSFAKENNLRSVSIKFRLDVVGQRGEPEDGVLYYFEVVKNDGIKREIWGYGIDQIMDPVDPVDFSGVRHLFPHVPDSVFDPLPSKAPDILLGNICLGLHPVGGYGKDSVGDLRVYESFFGDGWVIGGTHPNLQPANYKFTSSALRLARAHKVQVIPDNDSFWEAESLGVQAPKRCGKCLKCDECSDPAQIRSRKDQEELDIMKGCVKIVDGTLHTSYPFKRDPHCLPNNRATVIRMAQSQENRLIKTGRHDSYNMEIKKFIDRGVIRELSKQEIDEWKGPTNYISHHGVEKPDSVTTPLRIVTNSSLRNGPTSLNGCMIKGPNSLNSMLNIGLRFRCHESGMIFDLTKAYNSLKTGPLELHLRRLVWRFDPKEDWKEFGFTTMTYGDLPAAGLLEIGRDLTADTGAEIDPVAARKLKDDAYVDDTVTGGSKEEIDRMRGVQLEDGSFSGTMRQILDKGKLKIKTILVSGETDDSIKDLLGNKVLGYAWDATSDIMSIPIKIYLCNKKRTLWPSPPLTTETLGLLETTDLTKRICLSITNGSAFDFLGLACPFTVRFKLLMREFQEEKNKCNWDTPISGEISDNWKQLIAEAVRESCMFFPRSVRPKNAIGNPLVAPFGDGAKPAYSTAIYLQWQIPCVHGEESCDYDYDANLLCGKARVTPLNGMTPPRAELSGMVLETRLTKSVIKALQTEPSMKPVRVIPMTDSRCSISATETTVRALKPFFQNRVSEILDNLNETRKYCEVEDFHYVDTSLNPADLATRGSAKLADIGVGSFWQKGPEFLCCARDLWPISREFLSSPVPADEIREASVKSFVACLYADLSRSKPDKLPDLWHAVERACNFYNSLFKSLRMLARLIKGWKIKSRGEVLNKATLGEPNACELASAERLLLLTAMPLTASAQAKGKLDSLCPKKNGNIIVTSGRIGEASLSKLIGAPHLPILMPESRAAYLYMLEAHEGEHGTVHNGIVETLARSREKVWIHKGRDLAKKVSSKCYLCRRRAKDLAKQQMGKLKEESTTIFRPWTHVALDFAGPFKVKGAVNQRAHKKCWIAVYVCRSTKAVELLLTCGYDTESFLLKHEEFVARHGAPATVVSDRGTQLVSAGRVLAEKDSKGDSSTPISWDWNKITRDNAASNWTFVPIGSPHFNGLPEATIKVLKKTLSLALAPGVDLTYPEMVTLLAKISYTVNARPLGLTSVSPSSQQEDNLIPLTPNMLLLSRSSSVSPPLEYDPNEKFSARLSYIAEVEKDWWARWIKQVLPTLFSYKKWKHKSENLKVGELVMLHYPGNFKDDYCMAKVVKIHPSDDKLVRQVTITYRKKNSRESKSKCSSKSLIEEKVAIHRLHRLHLVDEELVGNAT